jgi:hypothetical protein
MGPLHEAGIYAFAVNQNCTRATSALVAPLLRAHEPERVSQQIEKRRSDVGRSIDRASINREMHGCVSAWAKAASNREGTFTGLSYWSSSDHPRCQWDWTCSVFGSKAPLPASHAGARKQRVDATLVPLHPLKQSVEVVPIGRIALYTGDVSTDLYESLIWNHLPPAGAEHLSSFYDDAQLPRTQGT